MIASKKIKVSFQGELVKFDGHVPALSRQVVKSSVTAQIAGLQPSSAKNRMMYSPCLLRRHARKAGL